MKLVAIADVALALATSTANASTCSHGSHHSTRGSDAQPNIFIGNFCGILNPCR